MNSNFDYFCQDALQFEELPTVAGGIEKMDEYPIEESDNNIVIDKESPQQDL